jgi:hypothetical protein
MVKAAMRNISAPDSLAQMTNVAPPNPSPLPLGEGVRACPLPEGEGQGEGLRRWFISQTLIKPEPLLYAATA